MVRDSHPTSKSAGKHFRGPATLIPSPCRPHRKRAGPTFPLPSSSSSRIADSLLSLLSFPPLLLQRRESSVPSLSLSLLCDSTDTRITRLYFSLITVVLLIYWFKPRGLPLPGPSSHRKTSGEGERIGPLRARACAWEAGRMGGDNVAAEAAVRVLVVDDSPVDRKVVELLLRNHKGSGAPFHVTTVDSGKKAMELLGLNGQGKLDSCAATDANELIVDIVLTDYCMPEMTGYDLLKAIKALSSLNSIPVVVMSSENEPQRISRCLTAGAQDFILKPLKSKDVQRLHNCSSARSPKDTSEAQCESLSGTRKPLIAKKVVSEQRSQLTGFSMLLNASSSELSHHFQYAFKFILLAYAMLCLSELLHRWSNGNFLSLWFA